MSYDPGEVDPYNVRLNIAFARAAPARPSPIIQYLSELYHLRVTFHPTACKLPCLRLVALLPTPPKTRYKASGNPETDVPVTLLTYLGETIPIFIEILTVIDFSPLSNKTINQKRSIHLLGII